MQDLFIGVKGLYFYGFGFQSHRCKSKKQTINLTWRNTNFCIFVDKSIIIIIFAANKEMYYVNTGSSKGSHIDS